MKNNDCIQEYWLKKFRRQLKQKLLKPFIVQWLATRKCNFNCGHCGTDASREASGELSTQEIFRAIDGLSKLGCKYLSVTGGEPLLREDLFEVFRYANSKEIRPSLVTNGFATEDFLTQLKKAKLYSASVSIDGYRSQHDRIRSKKGSYKRCMQSLEIYRRLKIPVIQVTTVVLKDNIEEIPLIISDAFKRGATRYRLQLIISEGRAKGQETPPQAVAKALNIIYSCRRKGLNVFPADNFGYLGKWDSILRGPPFLCGCGWWTFTIMQNGIIMGCPVIDRPELNEGRLQEKDIEEIWWDGFQRFRDIRTGELPEICRNCKYAGTCRGGCWSQRLSGSRFCYLDLGNKMAKRMQSKERRT
ncbi:MAG: radical SAM protein [Candidatus Omnitrophota bacterium]|jgi:radical SAM protein with 4Fe4S-binding SPASM domain